MTIWQAAAVGHTTELARWLAGSAVTADEVTNACWHACRAGQLDTARMLTERGADVDWLGYDHLTARQAALVAGNADLVLWLATI